MALALWRQSFHRRGPVQVSGQHKVQDQVHCSISTPGPDAKFLLLVVQQQEDIIAACHDKEGSSGS